MEFPNIELVGLNDEVITLSALIQKKRLNLVLFYNTNCLGCTGRAIPLAYNLQQVYSFINLIVIHSNFRPTPFSSEEVLSVFTEQKSPFNIYREDKHELYDYFNCEGTPHWVMIDGDGEIQHSFFGSQEGAQMKLEYALQEVAQQFS